MDHEEAEPIAREAVARREERLRQRQGDALFSLAIVERQAGHLDEAQTALAEGFGSMSKRATWSPRLVPGRSLPRSPESETIGSWPGQTSTVRWFSCSSTIRTRETPSYRRSRRGPIDPDDVIKWVAVWVYQDRAAAAGKSGYDQDIQNNWAVDTFLVKGSDDFSTGKPAWRWPWR